MNRFVGVGRLTRDVDLRYTANGNAVANFTVAIDRAFSKDDEADFINCVAWRATAENLANYMKKGSQIGIDGRLQTRTYEDKDGKTVYVTEVVADNIQFLDSRKDDPPKKKKTKEEVYNDSVFDNGGEPLDIDDSDLPF